jgi:hypothetical protein
MIVLPKVRLTPRALEKIAEALVADGCGGALWIAGKQ